MKKESDEVIPLEDPGQDFYPDFSTQRLWSGNGAGDRD